MCSPLAVYLASLKVTADEDSSDDFEETHTSAESKSVVRGGKPTDQTGAKRGKPQGAEYVEGEHPAKKRISNLEFDRGIKHEDAGEGCAEFRNVIFNTASPLNMTVEEWLAQGTAEQGAGSQGAAPVQPAGSQGAAPVQSAPAAATPGAGLSGRGRGGISPRTGRGRGIDAPTAAAQPSLEQAAEDAHERQPVAGASSSSASEAGGACLSHSSAPGEHSFAPGEQLSAPGEHSAAPGDSKDSKGQHKTKRKASLEKSGSSLSRCMSRVWGGGWGAQCSNLQDPGMGDYCSTHRNQLKRHGYLTHGRIDGPIPEEKAQEFAKIQKKLGSQEKPQEEQPSSRPEKGSARKDESRATPKAKRHPKKPLARRTGTASTDRARSSSELFVDETVGTRSSSPARCLKRPASAAGTGDMPPEQFSSSIPCVSSPESQWSEISVGNAVSSTESQWSGGSSKGISPGNSVGSGESLCSDRSSKSISPGNSAGSSESANELFSGNSAALRPRCRISGKVPLAKALTLRVQRQRHSNFKARLRWKRFALHRIG